MMVDEECKRKYASHLVDTHHQLESFPRMVCCPSRQLKENQQNSKSILLLRITSTNNDDIQTNSDDWSFSKSWMLTVEQMIALSDAICSCPRQAYSLSVWFNPDYFSHFYPWYSFCSRHSPVQWTQRLWLKKREHHAFSALSPEDKFACAIIQRIALI